MSMRDIQKRHDECYQGRYPEGANARMGRDITALLKEVAKLKDKLNAIQDLAAKK